MGYGQRPGSRRDRRRQPPEGSGQRDPRETDKTFFLVAGAFLLLVILLLAALTYSG